MKINKALPFNIIKKDKKPLSATIKNFDKDGL